MKTITLTVTIDEANLMLDGLGRMPFAKVYALIGKIQQQAKPQVSNGASTSAPAIAQTAPVDDEAEHVQ
jgi:hypothetical protein